MEVLGNQSTVVESMTRAEVDMQISTAKRFPRNLQKVKTLIMSDATMDPETAASCFYVVPRGGKSVRGPSIGLAKMALGRYGNCAAGARVVNVVTTGDNPHVVVQGVVIDYENNVRVQVEKTRAIHTKKKGDGTRAPVSQDDIMLTCNAGQSFALRDAILTVIPPAIIKPVMEQAMKVAAGNATSLNDTRAKLVEAFQKLGVHQKMILDYFGYTKIDEITVDDVADLRSKFSAIKEDGDPIEEQFPSKTQESAASGTAAPVNTSAPVATSAPSEATPKTRKKRETVVDVQPEPAPSTAAAPVQESPADTTESIAEHGTEEPPAAQQPPFEQAFPDEAGGDTEPNNEDANLDPASAQGKLLLATLKAGFTWSDFHTAVIALGWAKTFPGFNDLTSFSKLPDAQAAKITPAIMERIVAKIKDGKSK